MKGSGKPVQNVHKDSHISSHYTLARNKVLSLWDRTVTVCVANFLQGSWLHAFGENVISMHNKYSLQNIQKVCTHSRHPTHAVLTKLEGSEIFMQFFVTFFFFPYDPSVTSQQINLYKNHVEQRLFRSFPAVRFYFMKSVFFPVVRFCYIFCKHRIWPERPGSVSHFSRLALTSNTL